jgi:hypothetical protein
MYRPSRYIHVHKSIYLSINYMKQTVCVCVSFIDHSRTGLTAGPNDDGNEVLIQRKVGII